MMNLIKNKSEEIPTKFIKQSSTSPVLDAVKRSSDEKYKDLILPGDDELNTMLRSRADSFNLQENDI